MPRPPGHKLSRVAWDDVLRMAGLSLTQVADMAEVPRPTLSSLLGGHHKASVPMAHKIAGAVGCHPGTLFPTIVQPKRDEAAA
jgi:plasmid maintenance system antidote protein VapI